MTPIVKTATTARETTMAGGISRRVRPRFVIAGAVAGNVAWLMARLRDGAGGHLSHAERPSLQTGDRPVAFSDRALDRPRGSAVGCGPRFAGPSTGRRDRAIRIPTAPGGAPARRSRTSLGAS